MNMILKVIANIVLLEKRLSLPVPNVVFVDIVNIKSVMVSF